MLRFLQRIFLAVALVANVAPSVALASEAEFRKTAVEILEVERRLAGELDPKARATWSRERERLEKVARELARDELKSERRGGRNEDEDRIESVGVRVFEGRHAPRERERGTRGGERSRDESSGRDGDRTGADHRERDEERAGEEVVDDDDHEEDDEEDDEEDEEDEEEEEDEEDEEEEEEQEVEEEEVEKDESERDSDPFEA